MILDVRPLFVPEPTGEIAEASKGQSSKMGGAKSAQRKSLKRKLEEKLTLRRLDGMHSTGPLLGTYHFIGGREVHVLCAGDGHTTLGQLICVRELAYQGSQLIWGDL